MPRGGQGGPVVSREYPRWRDLGILFAFFGLFAPTFFSIMFVFVARPKTPATTPGIVFGMFAIFGGLVAFIVALLYATGGRVRYTPTTVLWVPALGRPKWVHFADVRRMRGNGKGFYVFDAGRHVMVPAVGKTSGRTKRNVADRERVAGWLDEQFTFLVQRPRAENIKIFIVTAVGLIVFIAVTRLGLAVFRSYGPRMVATVQTLTGLDSRMAALATGFFGMIAILGLASLVIPGTRRLSRFLNVTPLPDSGWRLRREKWPGFEVRMTPAVDPATPSL